MAISNAFKPFFGLFDTSNDQAFDDYSQYARQGQAAINQNLTKAQGYLSPYRTAGQNAIGRYQGMLDNLSDPAAYYGKIASSYSTSPGVNFRLKTGMDAVRNAMAARGLGGSGQEERELTDYTQGVIGEDMNQYIASVLGIGGNALQGWGNLTGMGEHAATTSGGYSMNAADDIASIDEALAQAAAQRDEANKSDWWGAIRTGASLLPMFLA